MPDHLFAPYPLRSLTSRNRIGVSPMCMYSSQDGFASPWHHVHLGQFAIGGVGIVMTEATAVDAVGRISKEDLGLYRDEHIDELAKITSFLRNQGAIPGVQLAHAGRKASTWRPWDGQGAILPEAGGWTPVAPSAIPFSEEYPQPEELTEGGIHGVVQSFVHAAERAHRAGFQIIEIHGAHGYLINEFLSPLTNKRDDGYGGSFENRIRFLCEIVEAVRTVWPADLPVFLRLSCSDWTPGGWTIEDTVHLAPIVQELGVDLLDASSGGNVPHAKIPVGAGYQTAFSAQVRAAGMPTGAVGMITSAAQADHIVRTGQADLVFLAREMLRDPYFARRAAKELGQSIEAPVQYGRAWV